jgi:hypothetical protein
LNESSTEDLKNTGLSFWDCWDNWVIEDIVDSGYNSIEKYFYETEVDQKTGNTIMMEDLESVWHLLNNNDDLRSRVFEKLILEVLMQINENVEQYNLEGEMSQISVLLSNNKTCYNTDMSSINGNKYLSFISEFSKRIIEIDFVKNSLQYDGLTKAIFNKCQTETNYFHYEDKLIEVIPKLVNDLLVRILCEMQVKFRISSINNMFSIYSK